MYSFISVIRTGRNISLDIFLKLKLLFRMEFDIPKPFEFLWLLNFFSLPGEVYFCFNITHVASFGQCTSVVYEEVAHLH